jgi:hypothetical protein
MTKKQFAKALNAKPPNVGRVVKAQDKFNGYLDRNPDVTPICWALLDALSLVECIANDEVEGHGKLPYTKLSGDQKIALIKEHARRMVVKAYHTGSI